MKTRLAFMVICVKWLVIPKDGSFSVLEKISINLERKRQEYLLIMDMEFLDGNLALFWDLS
jgi:hypothetical protein